MAASRSCIKCLKSTCEIVFHCIYWLKFCNLNMKQAVSQRCLIKEVFWKTSQNSQINLRNSHPEVFCQRIFLKILQNSQKNIFAGISFLIKVQVGNLKLAEAATEDLFLKILHFSQESLFVKFAVLRACSFIKKDSDIGAFLWNL